jgi:GNAT superfamily N-acetyltransferase
MNPLYEIKQDPDIRASALQHLRRGQSETNPFPENHPGYRQQLFVCYSAWNEKGEQVGGIYGDLVYDFASIHAVWVEPNLRNQGIGRALVEKFEAIAIRARCQKLLLSTVLLPSNPKSNSVFWEKLGYTRFARLEDCPKGGAIEYFHKSINI